MKKDRRANSSIIPVKLDQELATRVRTLAREIGEPDSTVMRLAIRAGLPKVKASMAVLLAEDNKPANELHYTHRP